MDNQIENVKTNEGNNTDFAVVTEVTESAVTDEDGETNPASDHEYVAVEVLEELECTCEDAEGCAVHQTKLIRSIKKGDASRWDFFSRVSKYRARCKRCAKLISHKSSTGNLLTHLRNCYRNLPIKKKSQRGYTCDRAPPIKKEDQSMIFSDDKPIDFRPRKRNRKKSRLMFQKYFERNDVPFKVRCRLCSTILSYKTTTANLYKHLRTKHDVIMYTENNVMVEAFQNDKESANYNEDVDTEHEVRNKMKMECNCDYEQTNMHSDDCPITNDQSYENNFEDNTMNDEDSNDDFTWAEDIQTEKEDNTKSNKRKSPCNKCGHKEKNMHYATCPFIKSQSQNSMSQVSENLWMKSEKNPLEQIYVDDDRDDDDDITIFTIEDDSKTTHYSKVKDVKAISNSVSTSKRDWDSSIDTFSAYVGSLLKLLPKQKVVKLQANIIETLLKEQMKPG